MELILREKGHIENEFDDMPLPNQTGASGEPINLQVEPRVNWSDQRQATPPGITEDDIQGMKI